ncbi:MAG: group III truncated hemoglobin [Pseudomonadales bacterium]|nr:group III truncated hemoglobin [Pseudomonadales bacterium]
MISVQNTRIDDSRVQAAGNVDLDSAQHIQQFVESFYEKILSDQSLEPIFSKVAKVDLNKHLPIICSYWEKLLLGASDYRRHTMNIHRAVDVQQAFTEANFVAWLAHFKATAAEFSGPKTDRAVVIASTIAANMQQALMRDQANRAS